MGCRNGNVDTVGYGRCIILNFCDGSMRYDGVFWGSGLMVDYARRGMSDGGLCRR